MKEKFFAILLGLVSGLIVYSFIGWMFTKNSSVGKRYIIQLILFLIVLGLLITLLLITTRGLLGVDGRIHLSMC
ncbi:MAG: hypothetical protein NC824_00585 [Candidatus Omnitrophica bacterium]|nr:hypothetical protein [Candidatus Omnitrophota bacterium]